MATLVEMLQSSTWGRVLTAEEFERVSRDAFERSVPKGAFAARAGEPVVHWIGVIDGLLKMSVATADGKMSTLTGINVGGWFGEGSLIKREPRRYDMVALRPSRIALVPYATFEWLRSTSMPFAHYLHNLMNARLSLFIGMLEYGRLLEPDERVARCVATLFNADLYPEPKPYVDLRQHEIALLSGLARSRVNIALKKLHECGAIRIEPRGLTVLDLDGLRNYANVR
jgi:CRP/FNR family transcriptional regulator, cyclic AMP receptor protein